MFINKFEALSLAEQKTTTMSETCVIFSVVPSVGNGPLTSLRFCLYDSLRFCFMRSLAVSVGVGNVPFSNLMYDSWFSWCWQCTLL